MVCSLEYSSVQDQLIGDKLIVEEEEEEKGGGGEEEVPPRTPGISSHTHVEPRRYVTVQF